MGFVPFKRMLFVDQHHHGEIRELCEYLAKNHGIEIKVTPGVNGQPDRLYPNNFGTVALKDGGYVVADRDAPIAKEKGISVIAPKVDITKLPTYGGSILCVSNISPTPKLWDALGIRYERLKH
jgi:hypothetical protein